MAEFIPDSPGGAAFTPEVSAVQPDIVGRAKRGIVDAARRIPYGAGAGVGTLAEFVVPGSLGEAASTGAMMLPGVGIPATVGRIAASTAAPAVIGALQGQDAIEEGLKGLGGGLIGEGLGGLARGAVRVGGQALGKVVDLPRLAAVIESVIPSLAVKKPVSAPPVAPRPAPPAPPPRRDAIAAIPPIGGTAQPGRVFEAGPVGGGRGGIYQGRVRETTVPRVPTTHVLPEDIEASVLEAAGRQTPPTRFSRQAGVQPELAPATVTIPPPVPGPAAPAVAAGPGGLTQSPEQVIGKMMSGEGRRALGHAYDTAVEQTIRAAGNPVVIVPALGQAGGKHPMAPAIEVMAEISSLKRNLRTAAGDVSRRADALAKLDWLQEAEKQLAGELATKLPEGAAATIAAAKKDYAKGMAVQRLLGGGKERLTAEKVRRLTPEGGLSWPELQAQYQAQRGALQGVLTPEELARFDAALRYEPLARDVPGRFRLWPRLPRRAGGLEQIAEAASRTARPAGAQGAAEVPGGREAAAGGAFDLADALARTPARAWSWLTRGHLP